MSDDMLGVEILRVSLPVRAEAQRIVGCAAREIAFLRIADGPHAGFGECAPLAGLHREGLDESVEAIERWSDGEIEFEAMPPSAAFAASCAIETSEGFGTRPSGPVAVAAFFSGGVEEIDDAAAHMLRAHRTVKLKIGRASEEADRALIGRVLELVPDARLRLDGNRMLTEAECVARVHGFDAERFEYLEDPLKDPSRLAALSARTGIAVALDETVVDGSPAAHALRDELAREDCVAAWVLRLSALGPLSRVRAIAREAEARGAHAVLSTAYESSYALRLAAHLAASLPNGRCAHGLGTASLLAEDSCAPAIPVAGFLACDPLPAPFVEAWS
ncbi:MAG: o-succinylbenzoate synthase [bacterium]|jgi:o-succinylbenzoate synthase